MKKYVFTLIAPNGSRLVTGTNARNVHDAFREVHRMHPTYSIIDIREYSNPDLIRALDILNHGTRKDILEWLQGNDRNGVYTDEACLSEGWPIVSLTDAISMMREVLDQ